MQETLSFRGLAEGTHKGKMRQGSRGVACCPQAKPLVSFSTSFVARCVNVYCVQKGKNRDIVIECCHGRDGVSPRKQVLLGQVRVAGSLANMIGIACSEHRIESAIVARLTGERVPA